MSYGAKRRTEPTTVAKQPKESNMETATVATETNDLDSLTKIIIDMEQNLHSKKDDINIMDARNDDIIESIEEHMMKRETTNSMKKNCGRQY